MKKRAFVFALTGMLAVSSLTGCSSFDGDAVAITVGDEQVTADVANFYARYTQAQYETYYGAYLGEDMWSSEATEGQNYEEYVKDTVQESLEIMVLSEKHMDEYDAALTDKEKELVDKAVKEFSEANTLEDKEEVSGDDETVERVMTLLAIQQKVQSAIEATVDTKVSDDEAAQKRMQYVRYDYVSYDDGNEVTVTDEEKADLQKQAKEFAEEAKSADDFEKLAKEKELSPQTMTFSADTDTLDAELVEAADKLKKNEVSDVIETEDACYVVKVTSLFDKKATESKKEEIIAERQSEAYDEICDKWLEEVEIKVNKDVWKKIDFNKLTISIATEETEPYADSVETDDVAE